MTLGFRQNLQAQLESERLMPLNNEGIYLGFDPGGECKFGVALLDGDCLRTSTVSNVDAAMDWAVSECGSRLPIAAGIDTLLHWATSESGTRPYDIQLRRFSGLFVKVITLRRRLKESMGLTPLCPHRPHERDLQRVGKTSSEIAKL